MGVAKESKGSDGEVIHCECAIYKPQYSDIFNTCSMFLFCVCSHGVALEA